MESTRARCPGACCAPARPHPPTESRRTTMTQFALFMFATDYSIQPVELAVEAEKRDFESLWFPEHTHIPASRKTPFPGGTDLPKEYWHTHDPFVALAAAATATKKLKLGTGVCLVIERDPITLAKEVASLDMISGGRGVSRRVRQFRSNLVLPQTRPAGRTANPHGIAVEEGHRKGGRLLRRVDAHQQPSL